MVKVRYLVVFLILFVAVNTGMVYAQSLDINDQKANAGDTVNFTISVNNAPNAVDAVQFDVSYDTSVLDFTNNFTKGSLVNSFTYFDVKENTGGQIRVAGITTTSLKAGTSGDVVKLEFTVKNCTNSTLTLTGLEDDLSGWSIGSGQFTCASSTATPTPTSTAKPSPTTTATPTPTPVTSPLPWGALSLSKSEAFLNGDSVVITLEDRRKNITVIGLDSTSVSYKSSSESTSNSMTLTETTRNSGTFIGTLRTSSITSFTSTPPTVRAVANGNVAVTYWDDSSSTDHTTSFTTKNFGAQLTFTSGSVSLGGIAVVSLYDPETNTSISQQNLVNINVKSTTDSSGTSLRLTETANDSGSFLGTIVVSSDNTLVNNKIKASVGDTLTVTFTDNPDASGSVSTVTDTVSISAAGTPTSTPSPSPVVSPTTIASPTIPPTVCEAVRIWTSGGFTLKRKKSRWVTVRVTDDDYSCPVEGEIVTWTINAAGKKRVSVSPSSAYTDQNGETEFEIKAMKKTGKAQITFHLNGGGLPQTITVEIKK